MLQTVETAASDDDLMHAARGQGAADAHAAFQELYRRHAGRLLAFLARSLEEHEAADCLQDVWLRVWRKLDSFQGGNFRAWLFGIARNLIIDLVRKRRPLPLNDVDPPAPATGLDEELADRRQRLARCLENLNEEDRTLVRLRLEGKGYPEIARDSGRKTEELHKRFHFAKKALQDCVKSVAP